VRAYCAVLDAAKDRTITMPLAPGRAEIVYRRSSAHPVLYAIMLRVLKGDEMVTVASVDNSHERSGVDTHHLHRYIRNRKQPPEVLPFSVADTNDAMNKVIGWFADNWEDLAS
jgi:hypothetical protein